MEVAVQDRRLVAVRGEYLHHVADLEAVSLIGERDLAHVVAGHRVDGAGRRSAQDQRFVDPEDDVDLLDAGVGNGELGLRVADDGGAHEQGRSEGARDLRWRCSTW